MREQSSSSSEVSIMNIIIGTLIFGSIWGFCEATLGGFLNLIIFPNKGAIMGGIGIAIMATALGIYRRPSMLPGIGVVAASFKLLNVWFLFVPISAAQVINPAMSIIIEATIFYLVALYLVRRSFNNALLGIGAGLFIGLVSSVLYAYFAVYIMQAPLFARMGVDSIGTFITSHGIVQATFYGLFLPLGIMVGRYLDNKILSISLRKPLYYTTSAATICLCWGLSIITVLSGL